MTILVDLDPKINDRLQADARVMGTSPAVLLAELAAKIYGDSDTTEENPEIIVPVQESIARYDAGERGIPLDTAFEELERRAAEFHTN
jgi:hypothetical protein